MLIKFVSLCSNFKRDVVKMVTDYFQHVLMFPLRLYSESSLLGNRFRDFSTFVSAVVFGNQFMKSSHPNSFK